MPRTEKILTTYGLFTDVILDLFEKSFDTFTKRSGKSFQVSPHENEYACSAIILLLTGLESFYSRLEYFMLQDQISTKEIKESLKPKKCSVCKLQMYRIKSNDTGVVTKNIVKY